MIKDPIRVMLMMIRISLLMRMISLLMRVIKKMIISGLITDDSHLDQLSLRTQEN